MLPGHVSPVTPPAPPRHHEGRYNGARFTGRKLHGQPLTWPRTPAAVHADPPRARGAGGAGAAEREPDAPRRARRPSRPHLRHRGGATRGAPPPHLAHLVAREPPERRAQLRGPARRLQRLLPLLS